MPFSSHIFEFLIFVLVGAFIGIIFDFFRAYRKTKKVSNLSINIQDIIYFLIVLLVLFISIFFFIETKNIRGYIFIAIIVGIFIYIKLFSKFVVSVLIKFIKVQNSIISFVILPEKMFFEILIEIVNFFKKYIKKCCKKFYYVISLNKKKVK